MSPLLFWKQYENNDDRKKKKEKKKTNTHSNMFSPATLCITVIAIVIHVSGSKMSYVNKVAHFVSGFIFISNKTFPDSLPFAWNQGRYDNVLTFQKQFHGKSKGSVSPFLFGSAHGPTQTRRRFCSLCAPLLWQMQNTGHDAAHWSVVRYA